MLIISTKRDLEQATCGGWDVTERDWAVVHDELVDFLWSHSQAPERGEDWTDFLNSLDISDLVCRLDDGLKLTEEN